MFKNKIGKLEKLKLIILTLVVGNFFGIVSQAQAASPVLYFSDLTDGPVSGWNGSPTKGAAVSIWGNNFGSSRGNSYVTIGGVNLTNDSDYAEWGATTNPTTARGLERITFWLNSNMSLGNTTITVTTPEGTSQSIPFYTRNTGHIYFVSPSGGGDGTTDSNTFSPHDYILKLEAGEDGDIAYFRSGTYSGEYAHPGWHANFCLDNNHSGILNNNNAFISYPGEIATLAMGVNADRSNFRLYSEPANYITIAKFYTNAQNGAITANTGWRVIGNYVNAIHELTGSGSIGTSLYQTIADDIEILGNIITGGSSGNKLDHAIYPGSGVTNLNIGWNYIYNNNFGNGPMISINSNDAYNHNLTTVGNIHDNFIDVTNYPSRAMGVFEVGINSHLYYYNNIINGHPLDGSPTVYAMSGDVHYYNNTLYNCGFNNLGACFSFYDSTVSGHHYIPDNVELKNNIVYANSQSDYYIRVSNNTPTPTIDHNLFFNILFTRTDDKYVLDNNVVTQDPLFSSATPSDYLDFQLQSTSPARNTGTTVATVAKDFLGILRPQGTAWDMGAYEFVESSGTEIRADVDQNSTINSTDAMLTLRNSLGLDMSSTNWVIGTHTGDVNCDDSSNSTDAMLILRKSLGLDMSGTGWCGN